MNRLIQNLLRMLLVGCCLMLCLAAANRSIAESAADSAGSWVGNLEISGNTVSAWYDAETEAILTVQILNEADDALINQKTKTVQEGSGTVNIGFDSLPADGFYAEAFLTDANGKRLSDTVGNMSRTQWAARIQNLKSSDYATIPEQVVELKSSSTEDGCVYEDGSFLVLQDDVVRIRYTDHTITELSDESNSSVRSFSVSDTSVSRSLQAGSKVFIDLPGLYAMGTVQSVSIAGGTVNFTLEKASGIITEGDEPEIRDEYIQTLKASAQKTLKLPINVNLTDLRLQGTAILTISIAAEKESGPKPIHQQNESLQGNSTYHIKTVMDMSIPDAKVTLKTDNFSWSKTVFPITIPEMGIPYVGGANCDIRLVVSVNATGHIGFSVALHGGIELWYKSLKNMKANNLCKLPDLELTDLDITGNLSLGLFTGPRVSILDVFSLGVNIGPSIVLTAGNDVPEYADEEKNSSYADISETAKYKKWHACEKDKCVQGNAHFRFSATGTLSLWHWSHTFFNIYSHDFKNLLDFYHSLTYNSGEVDTCPHYGYRLVVNLKGEDGDPVPDAEVSYSPYETNWKPKDRYKSVNKATTNSNGQAVLYVPVTLKNLNSWAGELDAYETTVTAVWHGPNGKVYASQKIQEKGYGGLGSTFDRDHWEKKQLELPEITLVLDTNSTVSFEDPGAVKATNMPQPIRFNPMKSKGVNLPDTVPEKSGNHFIGWNTNADGSGTSYMPGSFVETKKDLVLYAQFRVIADSYIVLFNPNGGSMAPEALIVPYGSSARIPEQKPAWEGMRFIGWSRQEDAFEAEYVPGDLLENPGNESVIVLYAVWEYSPVTAIRIRYDLNGGTAAKKPADQWIRPGSTLTITEIIPEREAYIFLGWSLEPNAGEEMYHPGQSCHFFDDTVLYAVWILSPAGEPIRISFDMNGAPEGLKPDNVWVKPGQWFRISDIRPVWDENHTFDGWSTDPRAARGQYGPGSPASFTTSTTLYAIWNEKKEAIISFDLSGGALDGKTGIIRKAFTVGTEIILPGPPVKKGYTFLYWQGSSYQPGDRYTVLDDHTFTAVWQKDLPVTGDQANLLLYAGMIAAGMLLLGVCAASSIKLRRKTK